VSSSVSVYSPARLCAFGKFLAHFRELTRYGYCSRSVFSRSRLSQYAVPKFHRERRVLPTVQDTLAQKTRGMSEPPNGAAQIGVFMLRCYKLARHHSPAQPDVMVR